MASIGAIRMTTNAMLKEAVELLVTSHKGR